MNNDDEIKVGDRFQIGDAVWKITGPREDTSIGPRHACICVVAGKRVIVGDTGTWDPAWKFPRLPREPEPQQPDHGIQIGKWYASTPGSMEHWRKPISVSNDRVTYEVRGSVGAGTGRRWCYIGMWRTFVSGPATPPWEQQEKPAIAALPFQLGQWYRHRSDGSYMRPLSVNKEWVTYDLTRGAGDTKWSHTCFVEDLAARLGDPVTPPWEQPTPVIPVAPPEPKCAPSCSPVEPCDRVGCVAREHLKRDAILRGLTDQCSLTRDHWTHAFHPGEAIRMRQPYTPRYAFAIGRRPWR